MDYIGAVQGIPVCFDAKECNTDTFPLQNIHEHQVVFMENFEKQRGIAFFLISFTARDEFYYLRLAKLLEFWNRAKEGGRKSFRYEELEPEFFVPQEFQPLIAEQAVVPTLVGIGGMGQGILQKGDIMKMIADLRFQIFNHWFAPSIVPAGPMPAPDPA